MNSEDSHPSLAHSITTLASSEFPHTTESTHSPLWKNGFKDSPKGSLTPKFTKTFLKLVSSPEKSKKTSSSRHSARTQQGDFAAHAHDLNARVARISEQREREVLDTRPSRDDLASWGRSSRASIGSRSPLESKHSSIGPLPVFPRTNRSHGRHSSISTALDFASTSHTTATPPDQIEVIVQPPEEDLQMLTAEPKPALQPEVADSAPSSRGRSSGRSKTRGKLANLFSLGSRKSQDLPKLDSAQMAQSTPGTPTRKGFLASKFLSTSSTSIRSAVNAAPPPLPLSPTNRANAPSPSPRIRAGRFSLPLTPRRPSVSSTHEETHKNCDCHPSQQAHQEAEAEWQVANLHRSKSDSKNGRGRSPGQSIRVPGPPQALHPHPHPYFPCDMPRNKAQLSHGSFDFERPSSRPSTPGIELEYKGKKSRSQSRGHVEDEQAFTVAASDALSLLAAGTEARRERAEIRRSSDGTGTRPRRLADADLLSKQPLPEPPSLMSSPRKTHIAHPMFSFEPAVSPTASQTALPTAYSYTRRILDSSTSTKNPHHQQYSSSTYVSYPIESTYADSSKGKGTIKHGLSLSTSSAPTPMSNSRVNGLSDRFAGWSGQPSSYRRPHVHQHSLSGSTAVAGHYRGPTGLGLALHEQELPSREERYFDLCESMRQSLGESRYKVFERAVRKYDAESIPLNGPKGLLARVHEVLEDASKAGLSGQTARRYYQTFENLVFEE